MTTTIKEFGTIINENFNNVNPKKSCYLAYFDVFMKCNSKINKNNQSLVINELDHGDNIATSISLFAFEEGNNNLKILIENIKRQIELQESENIISIDLPIEIQYATQFIEMLTICSVGKNGFTESKCQALLSIK